MLYGTLSLSGLIQFEVQENHIFWFYFRRGWKYDDKMYYFYLGIFLCSVVKIIFLQKAEFSTTKLRIIHAFLANSDKNYGISENHLINNWDNNLQHCRVSASPWSEQTITVPTGLRIMVWRVKRGRAPSMNGLLYISKVKNHNIPNNHHKICKKIAPYKYDIYYRVMARPRQK